MALEGRIKLEESYDAEFEVEVNYNFDNNGDSSEATTVTPVLTSINQFYHTEQGLGNYDYSEEDRCVLVYSNDDSHLNAEGELDQVYFMKDEKLHGDLEKYDNSKLSEKFDTAGNHVGYRWVLQQNDEVQPSTLAQKSTQPPVSVPDPLTYPCSRCTTTFTSAMDLWDHERLCGVSKDFPCEICGKFYPNRTSLRKHKYIHADEKKFLCTECGMRFNSNGNLKRHRRVHTGERPHRCEICQKCFAQAATLQNHIRTHTNERPFQCDICKKRFPRKGHLVGHMGTHFDFQTISNGPPARSLATQVDRAEPTFSGMNALDFQLLETPPQESSSIQNAAHNVMQHSTLLKTKMGVEPRSGAKERGTVQKNRSFGLDNSVDPCIGTVNSKLPSLIQSCEDQRPLSGEGGMEDDGNSEVTTVPTLQNGMAVNDDVDSMNKKITGLARRHDDTLSFTSTPIEGTDMECKGEQSSTNVCDIRRNQGARVSHMSLAHVETKVDTSADKTVIVRSLYAEGRIVQVKHFQCNICDKLLTSSNHLKEHKLIHTGGKPHKCNYCHKSFRNSGNLRRHERTHTGIRPYQCKICGTRFAQPGTLKNHMVTHSNQKPHLCYECGEGFTRKLNLRDHVQAVHVKERPYGCPFCNHRTFRQDRLSKHIDSMHGGRKGYQCRVCGRYFKTTKAVGKHHVRHRMFVFSAATRTNDRLSRTWQTQKQSTLMQYRCTTCNVKFSAPCYLRRHRMTHRDLYSSVQTSKLKTRKMPNQESRQVCLGSEMKVKNLENKVAKLRERLILDHCDESRFTSKCHHCRHQCAPSGCFGKVTQCHVCLPIATCSECRQCFTYPYLLRWHARLFHKTVKLPYRYTCNVCSKNFTQSSVFKLHLQFHPTRQTNKQVKKKSFMSKFTEYYRQYKMEWATVKRYRCKFCPKAFSFLGKLKHHESQHTLGCAKKPLQDSRTCNICNQQFTHAGALHGHMKTHAPKEERPHKCRLCQKRFIRPSHLKEHMLRHFSKKHSYSI